jgi:hypothetical protein
MQLTNGRMRTSITTRWVCRPFSSTRTPLLRKYLSALPNPCSCCVQVRFQDPRITCMFAWRPHRFATLFYNGTDGDGQYRYDDPVRHCLARLLDLLDEWALHNFYHHFLGASLVGLLRDTISQWVQILDFPGVSHLFVSVLRLSIRRKLRWNLQLRFCFRAVDLNTKLIKVSNGDSWYQEYWFGIIEF